MTLHRERRLIELGVLDRPAHRVLRSTTFPETWKQRCRLATMGPGNGVVSHAAAIRLHDLEGCDDDDRVHLLCRKGSWPGAPGDIFTHFTRGLSEDDVVDIDGIPVLSVPSTLALLRAHASESATARALISALRKGWSVTEIQRVAQGGSRGPTRSVVRHRSARSSAESLRLRRQPEQASRQQPTTDRVVVP